MPADPRGCDLQLVGDSAGDTGTQLNCSGPDGATFWPGGMQPGQSVNVKAEALQLKPGGNTVEFSCGSMQEFPGDVAVLLYRLWPMEE